MIKLGNCLKRETTANLINGTSRGAKVFRIYQQRSVTDDANGHVVYLSPTQVRKLAQQVKDL